jgi:hypothetical protein
MARIVREAGTSGIDVHVIARREVPGVVPAGASGVSGAQGL